MTPSQRILNTAVETLLEKSAQDPDYYRNLNKTTLQTAISAIQAEVQTKLQNQIVLTNQLDTAAVSALKKNAKQGVMLEMRHGEQLSHNIAGLDAEMAKITQMRRENNTQDEITETSALDFIPTMVVAKYLKDKHGIQISVATSGNRRAIQPAAALAAALEVEAQHDARLDCVDYPEAEVLSDGALKQHLNNGALPWDEKQQKQVDAVCGEGTYQRITDQVSELLDINQLTANQLHLMMTHTQQINAASKAHGQPVSRFNSYGYMGVDRQGQSFVFDKGVSHADVKQTLFNQKTQKPAVNRTPEVTPANRMTPGGKQ